jgi:hypothetical protein
MARAPELLAILRLGRPGKIGTAQVARRQPMLFAFQAIDKEQRISFQGKLIHFLLC